MYKFSIELDLIKLKKYVKKKIKKNQKKIVGENAI